MSRFAVPSPGSRSAAAELARLLDDAALSTVRVSGEPGSPAALAGLARRLQAAVPAVAPRPEFRAALRTRLLAVAAVAAVQSDGRSPGTAPVRAAAVEGALSWSRALRARRGVGVAVGAMASVVAVAAVGAAGARSLPGEPFYGVKRAGEGLALRTADGPLERGTTHLDHAGERLDEVARLVGRGDVVALAGGGLAGGGTVLAGASRAELVVETLDDMDEDTLDGHRLLMKAASGGSDPAPLATLTSFSAHQDLVMEELAPSLPLAARKRMGRSRALVDEVAAQALGLLLEALPPAPGAAPPADPAPSATPPAATSGTLPSPAVPLPGPSDDDDAQAPSGSAASPAPVETEPAQPGPGDPGAPGEAPGEEPAGGAPGEEPPGGAPTGEAPAPPPVTSGPAPAPSGGSVVQPLPVPVPPTVPPPVPVPTIAPVPPVPPVPVPTLPSVSGIPSLPGPPALPGAPVLPGLLRAAPVEPVAELTADADPGLRVVATDLAG